MYNFELRPLYVQFKYQSTSLPTVAEVGVVEAGALSCLLVFCIFVVIVAMFFKVSFQFCGFFH